MKDDLTFGLALNDILPDEKTILVQQGYPDDVVVNDDVIMHLSKSFELFSTAAEPKGMVKEVSPDEFAKIIIGEGKNEPDIPLENIFPKASRLNLYAITMGNEVSSLIENYFKNNDFLLGSFLDSIASTAAENGVAKLEESLSQKSEKGYHVLGYSPGYCGWHISAQKKIFEFLKPGKIGISLNESFLMTPLKSTTGVLVEGKNEIHIFANNFLFCKDCRDKTCRERINKFNRMSSEL